jgi:uncharacterized membrane protein YhaH (DUF805 family)
MLAALKYNLAHLTQFSGRDARQTFWLYVLFLVVAQIAISMAISIPLTGSMMGDAFVAARDGATPEVVQARMFERMSGMMKASMWLSVVLSLLSSALLAAAFTRRLHDSDKTGWIAAATFALQLVAMAMVISSIDDAVRMVTLVQAGDLPAMQGLQKKFAVQSLIGWMPAAIVIVFGVWPSTKGENRYGPEPLPA